MIDHGSQENTVIAVELADGCVVESVYYGSGTLCLSSQVGCAMGCPFCASGANGLLRSLTGGELRQQVAAAGKRGLTPRRLTLSGIGEPLQNPGPVKQFIENSELPVSLTTTGKPLAGLAEFLHLPHNGLMISLHAGTAATHCRVMPRGPDFEKLWQVLADNWPLLSGNRRRRLGINYLLLSGINDSMDELAGLYRLMQPFPEITLHLLVLNRVEGSAYTSPPRAAIDEIHGFFSERNVHVRRANRWRQQQKGGCGTLVAGKRQERSSAS